MTFFITWHGIELKLKADTCGDEIDGGLSIYHLGCDITDLFDNNSETLEKLRERFYEALNEHRGGR